MTTELPNHLQLNLPAGEWLGSENIALPPESLRAWRLRHYQLCKEHDPEMKERLSPEPEPFVFHE